MSINQEKIVIANIEVDVVRKDIKHMHLAVYPPHGRVRLASPLHTDREVMRLFAIAKLGWIKKHIQNFKNQDRESPREYISGESHYVGGQRYLLNVLEREGYSRVEFKNNRQINLWVRPGCTLGQKASIFKEWYRKELKKVVPP
jgi:predicted metal-dependent hydrolase